MITAAAVALTLASCGSTPLDDTEGGLSSLDQMQVPVIMSVLPTAGDNSADNPYGHGTMPNDPNNPLLAAESCIKPERLYIATYSASDKKLLDVIYSGGAASTGVTFYDHTLWGPTFAFTLDNSPIGDTEKGKYDVDFYIVALAIPEAANASYSFPETFADIDLSLGEAMKDLTGSIKTVKTQLESNPQYKPDVFIPMAGCELITNKWLTSTYNKQIYGVAPLQIPSIRMTRAVAKVVIEDVDGIIASAAMGHNAAGHLLPPGKGAKAATDGVGALDAIWWSQDGVSFNDTPDAVPNVPTSPGTTTTNQTTQTLDGSDATKPKEGSKYVFYSYEHDFNGKKGDDPARGMITLTPTTDSKLSGTKTIYIAPYEDGKVSEKSYAEIMAMDSSDPWKGLLRNHCYTFTVTKPANGDIQIYVKATQWTYHRIPFEF